MTAGRLLRLYPRAWRERYGEEFLETIGEGALHVQQVVDIVSGAIDAWLSPEVRRAVRPGDGRATETGARPMNATLKAMCGSRRVRYSTRDSLIAGAVILAGAFGASALGVWLGRSGYEAAGDVVLSLSFTVPFTLSMPFWIMKGQPWRAQVVIVGATLMMLMAIAGLAVAI